MKKVFKIFESIEEENQWELERRRAMTTQERWAEFGALQRRRWGEDWGKKPMMRVASFEKVDWI